MPRKTRLLPWATWGALEWVGLVWSVVLFVSIVVAVVAVLAQLPIDWWRVLRVVAKGLSKIR